MISATLAMNLLATLSLFVDRSWNGLCQNIVKKFLFTSLSRLPAALRSCWYQRGLLIAVCVWMFDICGAKSCLQAFHQQCPEVVSTSILIYPHRKDRCGQPVGAEVHPKDFGLGKHMEDAGNQVMHLPRKTIRRPSPSQKWRHPENPYSESSTSLESGEFRMLCGRKSCTLSALSGDRRRAPSRFAENAANC